jgi:hypothetical protein
MQKESLDKLNKPSDLAQAEMRQIINQEYLKRCKTNPQYSLRSFAKYLQLDPTFLSRLMRGERRLTPSMTSRLCSQLNIKLTKTQRVLTKLSESKQSERKLSGASFSTISRWYFFAILDLFLTTDFEPSSEFISKRLGLNISETKAAIEVLLNQGHLEWADNKLKVVTQSTIWSTQMTTSRERKEYQKQLLDLGRIAVDEVDYSARENASLTLPANSKLVPEIKQRIQNFKNELRQFIESYGDYDEVYQVAIAYYPLTKLKINKESL